MSKSRPPFHPVYYESDDDYLDSMFDSMLDSIYMEIHKERNEEDRKTTPNKYLGATVKDSIIGMNKERLGSCIPMEFSGLYPSLNIPYNLYPSSYGPIEDGPFDSPSHRSTYFSKYYKNPSNFGIPMANLYNYYNERSGEKPKETINEMDNELIKLLKEFPNENWDYMKLSENPNITLEYVINHPDKQWDWCRLTRNKSITLQDIESHPDLSWDCDNILKNPNIPLTYILNKYPNCSMKLVSQNYGITVNDIESHMDLQWEWFWLSENPNINNDFVLRHIDEVWFSEFLTVNPGIDPNDIETNKKLKLSFDLLHKNPNLKMDFILQNEENFTLLAKVGNNSNITLENVVSNLTLCKHNYHYQYYYNVTCNPYLNIDFLLANPEICRRLDWNYVAQNPGLTPDELWKYFPEKLEDKKYVSYNPNITCEFVKKHQRDFIISFPHISENKFKFDPFLNNKDNVCYL